MSKSKLDIFYEKLDKYAPSSYCCDSRIEEVNQLSLRDDFIKRFNETNIKNMTLEEYCFKAKTPGSFCHDLEHLLRGLGSITGTKNGTTRLYNIYSDDQIDNLWHYKDGRYSKSTSDRKFAESILADTKKSILSVIEIAKGNMNDRVIDSFEKIKLNSLTKNKIAYLYGNPNESIPIYSKNDLGTILNEVEINYKNSTPASKRRLMLFDFYKEHVYTRHSFITPYVFMCFLYHDDEDCGYGYLLKQQKESATSNHTINGIDSVTAKIHGTKGEDYVEERLKAKVSNGEIKKYHRCCGTKKEDGIGYDFTYTTNAGKKILVEVKSTDSDYNPNSFSFPISAHERDVYMKNKSRFVVFYVTNVMNDSKRKIHALHRTDIENGRFDVRSYDFVNPK